MEAATRGRLFTWVVGIWLFASLCLLYDWDVSHLFHTRFKISFLDPPKINEKLNSVFINKEPKWINSVSSHPHANLLAL